MKILIQTNEMQEIASKVSAASFRKFGFEEDKIFFLDFKKNDLIQSYLGKKYLRNGKLKTFKDDLQSFTLLRFLGPEFLNYNGKALIIDPDVFAIKDPSNIYKFLNDGTAIACSFYNKMPRSEVMLVDCSQIRWNFKKILSDLFSLKVDYKDLMDLSFDKSLKIKELSKSYNSHDIINHDTILLHTTNRITQPWKEGLNIDFERHTSQKYKFKQFIKKIIGLKYNKKIFEDKYQRHPEQDVIDKFKELFYFAKENNFINEGDINISIKNNFFSKKFLEK